MVTNELRGEKVDIVPFSEDPSEFVMRALQPAKVKEVRLDDATGTATVVVHDYQLSLAIGKEGQNARLAARLTGWRIDIKSETQLAEEEAGYAGEEWAEGEWVRGSDGEMVWQPAEGGEAISAEQWSYGDEVEGEGGEAAAEAAAPTDVDEVVDEAVSAIADGEPEAAVILAEEAVEAEAAEAEKPPDDVLDDDAGNGPPETGVADVDGSVDGEEPGTEGDRPGDTPARES